VFGPKQSPSNPYAAVIPLFLNAALKNKDIIINGDGNNARDFTYIDNVVAMNTLALFTENDQALNQVYNVACGQMTTLNDLVEAISQLVKKPVNVTHGPERVGDVRFSLADISKASDLLGYRPTVNLYDGLSKTLRWMDSSFD
jgi:UDP-N-acetylglucosamine 4-epimerase